jgi:3-methyladenine DNA glycosylase AlkD
VKNAVAWFKSRFKAEGKPERAAFEQRYMKTTLNFHGVDAKSLRNAARDYCAAVPLDREPLIATVEELYATDWFDLRSAGIGLLERKRALLTRDDAEWLISLVRRSGYWAHVDWLATSIVPHTLAAKPSRQLRAWAKDDDFWVRRTALLAQLTALRSGGGDFELFCALATPMLGEKEFFIRKAIGWVLREVGKKRPALVKAYVAEHGDEMSGLTKREALKRLGTRL